MRPQIQQLLLLLFLLCIGILALNRIGYFDKELETYETEQIGDGSFENPYSTIQQGLDAVDCPDTTIFIYVDSKRWSPFDTIRVPEGSDTTVYFPHLKLKIVGASQH